MSVFFPKLQINQVYRKRFGPHWQSNACHPKALPAKALPAKALPALPALAIIAKKKNALRIVSLNAQAQQAGLFIDQPLTDARALCPNLEVEEQDEPECAKLINFLADWCERYTPLVALGNNENSYGLFMDITGCAHLFGGESGLMEDLDKRLNHMGFEALLALANTPGAAWAASRNPSQYALQNAPHSKATSPRYTIIPPHKQEEYLAPMPLSCLRIEEETRQGLLRMGLKTIGCLTSLARAPLAARFGTHLLARLDEALGRCDEPISPRRPPPQLASEKRFFEPISRHEDIEAAIVAMANNLSPLLEKHGLGARSLNLTLFRVDGARQMLHVETITPLMDPVRMARLFFERIAGLHDELDVGFGFDIMRLEVGRAEQFLLSQTDLIDGSNEQEELHHLLERIIARLGAKAVRQFILADTHIPERSFTQQEIHNVKQWINHQPHNRTHRQTQITTSNLPAKITRPILLLQHPERINVIAEVPEGAPLRFQWRKVMYEITCSEGPERIACEWWRDGRGAITRDYFRVEDQCGYRFWLFRHGLYDRETAKPCWYMHGMFA